jgi:hypothetical protein
MPAHTEGLVDQPGSEASAGQLSALKRFARARPQVERCEVCSAVLSAEHQHLLDRNSRQVACACEACAILFCDQQSARFLRVPRRVRQLHDFSFTDQQWEELMLPINLAFVLRDSTRRLTVLYPSPAGAVESQLSVSAWEEHMAAHPALCAMEPEVEALIVNRVGSQNAYFIAPIDECYRLVGLIRTKWRGLSGSPEVWGAVAAFFEDLRCKAGGTVQVNHA